jgi:hypothetical protein
MELFLSSMQQEQTMKQLTRLRLLMFAGTAVLSFAVITQADIISFNAVGGNGAGMSASDTAGAPGASAANWNNMVENVSSPATGITGSITAGNVVDDADYPGTDNRVLDV